MNKEALQLLLQRRSVSQLQAPAPDDEALELMFRAAAQVPDHGLLQPYRFVVIRSAEAKHALQALLEQVAQDLARPVLVEKAQHLLQAPILIFAIMSPKTGQPLWKQNITAGCAAHAVQLAAKAQGFDSFWLSGFWVDAEALRSVFLEHEDERIIGIIKVGSAVEALSSSKNIPLTQIRSFWHE